MNRLPCLNFLQGGANVLFAADRDEEKRLAERGLRLGRGGFVALLVLRRVAISAKTR